MKAILVNEEIKTFGKVPSSWTDENGTHLNIGDGASVGFKDVVYPTYAPRIEKLDNLHLNGDVYTYDIVNITIEGTLAELKEQKVSELKMMVGSQLSTTDWYVIRHADVGTEIPAAIKEARADLRDQSNIVEAQINALTTKKAVVLFDINL
jgi:hypothetical protein